MTKLTYTAKDIAHLFGKGMDWWRRNRDELISEQNFPEPLPSEGRPCWSRKLVDFWFASNGTMIPAGGQRTSIDYDALTVTIAENIKAEASQ